MAAGEKIYGVEAGLAVLALVMATIVAVVFPLTVLTDLIPTHWAAGFTAAAGGLAALLFVRLMFSPDFHYAISRANAEMLEDRAMFFFLIRLNDPDWGLFGAKMGQGYIVPLRLVLMAEFLLVFLVPSDRPALGFMFFSGNVLWILLVQAQMRNHYPRPRS